MTGMKEAIKQISEKRDLTHDLATGAMDELMSGNCTDALISAFLIGLKLKGESTEEITCFAKVMREKSIGINPKVKNGLVDVCGTGGAKLKTFNISTISAFVMAGAGCTVAKHGNRSNTSKSGSADLLEALGVNLGADFRTVERSIEELGIGFLYAPNLHPAMKYAAGPRSELGIRTVFNILGPLTNPAKASCHLMGVFDPKLVDKFPQVLKNLGVKRALVVHGLDGIDEISTLGETYVGELESGRIKHYKIHPEQFGLKIADFELINNLPPAKSARLAAKILRGDLQDERLEIVLLNSGAGIYVAGKAESIQEGIGKAKQSIRSGAGYGKLVQLVQKTGGKLTI